MGAIGKIFVFVDIEEQLHSTEVEEGKVYVCRNDQIFQLKCPCGCKDVIKGMLQPGDKPSWTVTGNSMIPSIRRLSGCQSHFTITNGIAKNHYVRN